ncbi:hypothetical protein GOP47_0004478 [Adiantum capillus-veneris]|uniref:Reticulon-like protein n=1 Tax=Adiantum capillus-veneris TaxID=13818 RepID=A0A9D4ZQD4_ADICA|nr:hypothetical protein GOP47_0003791 [Adiantum capillus-veneris]KAI5081295.1 hypothetical protein GOP47_0004478 [Adiantum capillus-veneris]
MAADGASSAAAILSSVLENFKNLPASSPAHSSSHFHPSSGPRFDSARLFGRQRAVHDLLGGGHSADVLLWRKRNLSAGFLAVATVIWVLFEWIGYHFISVVSFFLLVAIVGLFAWSYAALMLNRDPPPVPKLELPDEVVLKVAKTLNMEINKMLNILHEIAIGKDPVRFAKLVGALALLVLFGSWFQFLTLFYLAIVAVHTLPVLYEKNEDVIDRYAQRALDELNNQFRKVDTSVLLSKIPRGPAAQKRED